MRSNLKRTFAFSLLLLAVSLAVAQQPPLKKLTTYKISGHATGGTQVNLYGPSTKRTATVQENKMAPDIYEFAGVAAGTYTARPSKQGCTFQPAERTVTVTDADVSGVDFTITCPPPNGRGGQDPSGRGRGQ
jgi:hypothetical protein